jgi:hypothetical protein
MSTYCAEGDQVKKVAEKEVTGKVFNPGYANHRWVVKPGIPSQSREAQIVLCFGHEKEGRQVEVPVTPMMRNWFELDQNSVRCTFYASHGNDTDVFIVNGLEAPNNFSLTDLPSGHELTIMAADCPIECNIKELAEVPTTLSEVQVLSAGARHREKVEELVCV